MGLRQAALARRARSFRKEHAHITYHPGTSTLHRLHPLTKLAWLIAITVCVFAVQNPWGILALAGGLAVFFPLNHLPLRRARGMRLFAGTGLLLILIQSLFFRDGTPLFTLGPLAFSLDGLLTGLYVAGRLWSVLLSSYLFVFTTDPNDLAYALMQIGLPYRYGFALITALRLVPLFEQEGRIVYQAQLARGIAYDTGGLRQAFTLARQFFLPLLVSALGKVDALAVSMEGRCFGKYPRRTFLREVHFTRQDGVLLGALALIGMVRVGIWMI